MTRRLALALLLLLLVLGGGALIYRHEQRVREAPQAGALGQPLIRGLTLADMVRLRIVAPNATLTLARTGDQWTIAERGGFPADFGKLRRFLLKAIELKIGQSEPIGADDRARLDLLDPGKGAGAGTLLEFLSADGKPLAQLLVGKKYFKRAPADPAAAMADGRFVLLPGKPDVAYVVSDPLLQATAASSAWIDGTGVRVEKVKSLALRSADGSRWRIERAGANAPWKLDGARAGEKLEVTKANAATYSLSLLSLADVAPDSLSAEQAGFDKPSATIDANTLDGLDYRFTLGRLQGKDYYVRMSVAGAKVSERDQQLARHTLLIDKSKFDDVLKKRAELLEKKK
jgi:hypothetical protein